MEVLVSGQPWVAKKPSVTGAGHGNVKNEIVWELRKAVVSRAVRLHECLLGELLLHNYL